MPDRATVVVGIDGTAPSRAALRWALRHAERIRAQVCAVAVWQQPVSVTPPDASGMTPVIPDAELEAQARSRLDAAIAELPDDAKKIVTPRVEVGDPRSVLLERARDAEMLVLGNDRHGAVAGAVVGSVALSCVHHADGPVVLVPEEHDAQGPPPLQVGGDRIE
jgi:nucleotide-binding universal stress UspA family protein